MAVQKLVKIETMTSDETVALLESLLAQARAGKITGIVAAGVGRRKRCTFAIGGSAWDDAVQSIGVLRLLEDELIRKTRNGF